MIVISDTDFKSLNFMRIVEKFSMIFTQKHTQILASKRVDVQENEKFIHNLFLYRNFLLLYGKHVLFRIQFIINYG